MGMFLSKMTMLIGGQEELTTTQKEKRVGIVNVKDAVVQKILVRHRNLALAYNGSGVYEVGGIQGSSACKHSKAK